MTSTDPTWTVERRDGDEWTTIHRTQTSWMPLGESDAFVGDKTLREMHASAEWPPGTYRLTVRPTVGPDTGRVLLRREAELPEPTSWVALDYASQRFGYTALAVYPGLTKELFAEHQDDFGEHYNARITTAELTERTGYELPAGTPRPSSPGVDHNTVAAHP